jgi:Werner syndrome ATP-dependent helicase
MDEYEKSKIHTKRYRKIKKIINIVYGFDNFRSKQYEIINRIINGEDVCAIMPTGIGKSLCYQIPAIYLNKPAIIISPLISLMDDQKMNLNDLGISSCCYNSNVLNKLQMRKDILQYKYQIIYITPESIITVKNFLVDLEKKLGISLIAIDEAHCISSYGFDFRKSYRELTFIKEILPNIPILAVTATATEVVSKDICKVLCLKNYTLIKTSFNRPNLYLEVNHKNRMENDIIPIVQKFHNQSIIIYCLTKKNTVKISEILKTHKITCGIYHADLDDEEKKRTHRRFIRNKIKVVVATIAFGMGINKMDVRAIIHYGAPKNIEGYYQEIGRAGRDGDKAYCYAFYNNQDFIIQKGFIANCNDLVYQKNQLVLLEKMKHYVNTKQCRRKVLLEYFGEKFVDECNFCDNCCGKDENVITHKVIKNKQDVQKEAKLLIELIESLKKNYGLGTYINILRGSNNKNISPIARSCKYYGAGTHRSIAWWKELGEHLIKIGFLQQYHIQGNRFAIPVIRVTKDGVIWSNMSELNGLLGGLNIPRLEPIEMINSF